MRNSLPAAEPVHLTLELMEVALRDHLDLIVMLERSYGTRMDLRRVHGMARLYLDLVRPAPMSPLPQLTPNGSPLTEVRMDRFGEVWSRKLRDSLIRSPGSRVSHLSWAALEELRGPLTKLTPETTEEVRMPRSPREVESARREFEGAKDAYLLAIQKHWDAVSLGKPSRELEDIRREREALRMKLDAALWRLWDLSRGRDDA